MDLSTIITAVVVGVLVFLRDYLKERTEKKKAKDKEIADAKQKLIDKENLAAQLEKAADKLAGVHARQLEEKEKKIKEEKLSIQEKSDPEFVNNIDREVKHETKKIRDRYNAMRVYVIHFSDGAVTLANLHLLKITFLHEVIVDWTDIRVEAVSKFFKEAHMPDMFSSPMNNVFRIGEYYLKDRETLDLKDVHTRDYNDWLKAYKVKSTLWIAIRSNKGKIVAVLVCHWSVKTDLDGTVIAKIKDINRTIEQVYDKYKHYEN